MANQTELLPLVKYADIEETIAAEAGIRRAVARVSRVQAAATWSRMSFPDFIEFHDRHREHRIDGDRSQFYAFARGLCGPGNLTVNQWYQAWDAWINLQDPRDLRDTQECAADIAVQ